MSSCKYCGKKHPLQKETCPAYGKQCLNYQGRNHVATVCKSADRKPRLGGRAQAHMQKTKVHVVEEENYVMTITEKTYSMTHPKAFGQPIVPDRTLRPLPSLRPGVHRPFASLLAGENERAEGCPDCNVGMTDERSHQEGKQDSLMEIIKEACYVVEGIPPGFALKKPGKMGVDKLQQLLVCKDDLLVKVLSNEPAAGSPPFEEATVSTETATATTETATATTETATATTETATATTETATATSETATATSETATATTETATATTETATATTETATATSETANATAIQEPPPPFKEPTLQARRSQTATETLENICEGEAETPTFPVECFLQKRIRQNNDNNTVDTANSAETTIFADSIFRDVDLRRAFQESSAKMHRHSTIKVAIDNMKNIKDSTTKTVIIHLGTNDLNNSKQRIDSVNETFKNTNSLQASLTLRCQSPRYYREVLSHMAFFRMPDGRIPKNLLYSELANGTRAPAPSKVKAIVDCPAPTTPGEVQSLLGMTNFLSRFVPEYASIVKPLRDLTRQSTPWTWGKKQNEAFDAVKTALSHEKNLSYL
ncbi:hypothetical protein Bbelb_035430 [Branchiostoma belcheri]|nr:hypothetical protein Bbelb_035430 [Branchiostoma belcheri]